MSAGIPVAAMVPVEAPRVVKIHKNMVVVPVEPGPCKQVESDEKRRCEVDKTAGDESRRIVPVIGWICRIPPRTIYAERVVGRHIDNRRVCRFDPDYFLLDYDLLFVGCFEIPLLLGLLAQFLNGSHNIIRLVQVGISQLPCLVESVTHCDKYVREMAERFHTGVPGLFLQGVVQVVTFQPSVLAHPAFSFD
jgi:hypothetical protein